MLPNAINLHKYGSYYSHQIILSASGELLTTSNQNPTPTVPIGPDYWIKSSDRSPNVGSGFNVSFGQIQNGAYPSIGPIPDYKYHLISGLTVEWKWSGSGSYGYCRMAITPVGMDFPEVSMIIYFQ